MVPSSSGLGHHPLKVEARVRIPLGLQRKSGEVISTGTCTGHLFAQSGDVVSADFASLGVVQVEFT